MIAEDDGKLAFRWYFGSTALNFGGTLGRRRGPAPIERLGDPQRLAAWLVEADLLSTAPVVTAAELREAIALREAIWSIADAFRRGSSSDSNAIASLNRSAQNTPVTPQLDDSARAVHRTGNPPVRAALASIARDAIELFASSRAASIRACEGVDCGGLYVDDSRGNRRRWCSMERCGNAAKVAAFRTRNR